MDELASVIIVTYNSRHYMDACLRSVAGQEYPHEVILVDNDSRDGTAAYVEEAFPEVTVIRSPLNRGYGAGNNCGVRHAEGTYIVVLNPDVVVGPGWLRALIEPLQKEETLITTPKILMFDGTSINTCGNINHFTGLSFTRGLGADPATAYCSEDVVSGVSGACFALSRESYQQLGGLDEAFFMYNEDADLSWRANLLGHTIRCIPQSLIYHDYTLQVTAEKLWHLEKGRYLILRKYLSRRQMLLLLPSLLAAEVLTAGYAARFGLKGIRYAASALISGCRLKVSRVNGDTGALFARLARTVPEDQLTTSQAERSLLALANRIFRWNFRLVYSN